MLGDGGFVVLVTPKPGSAGEVEASEIEEAAVTAGLHGWRQSPTRGSWRATKLASPKAPRTDGQPSGATLDAGSGPLGRLADCAP